MKEIIYLDTDQMNSMLAQLDEGIINSFSLEQSNQESETEGQQSISGKKAGFQGSAAASTGMFPGGGLRLNASIGNSGSESTNESRTMLEGQKDVLNKAFHDHALEVLINKLFEKELLSSEHNLIEGDLYLGESTYRFYDFNLIKKAMDHNLMKKIILHDVDKLGMSIEEAQRLIKKKKPNAIEREKLQLASFVIDAYSSSKETIDMFIQLNQLSNLASNLLEGLTVIKTDRYIGLLKKEYLREAVEALSFRTDTSRKIKFLIRVIGVKEIVYNGFNIPNLNENDLDVIPNIILDIILDSFKIVAQGDLIVTPIAIYYE